MKAGRIEIQPGFLLLLLCVFLWLDQETGGCVLAAWLVHEGAHILFLYLLGGKIRRLRLTLLGIKIVTQQEKMGYGREVFCILAGPGANLLLSLVLSVLGEGREIACAVNLALGIFNLIPLPGLDGGRIFRMLILMLTKQEEI